MQRAARLFGAAARLRETVRASILPVDLVAHEADVAAIHERRGDATFAAAWTAGAALTAQQAITEALTPLTVMALSDAC